MIRIAVQKSGRLHDQTMSLLKECGIDWQGGSNALKAKATNFPAEFLFLRDDDIPQYVEDGVAHIGILGENVVAEKNKNIAQLLPLGFSKCRLSLAVPKQVEYSGIKWFNGKKIATSYPEILGKFLEQHQIEAEIHEISGSVEIAPGIGLADGICDIVSSGSTLFSNGLKEVDTVFHSQAVLIAHNHLASDLSALLDKIIFRINAAIAAANHKYVLLNAPNDQIGEIIKILPGMKSPTIMPLAEEGWSSVHAVFHEKEFWDKIDQLQALGAQGILVVPIEKMIR